MIYVPYFLSLCRTPILPLWVITEHQAEVLALCSSFLLAICFTHGSLIPGSGRTSGGGHGNPIQDSCLENPMDWAAWQVTAHRLTQSPTPCSDLYARMPCIYVSGTFSPYPTVSTGPFTTSVSPFLPWKYVHQCHFSRFHMYALISYICFSLSDLLHSV